MSIQPEDEHRRGGFREAVNELFGRGERGDGRDTSQLDALERDEAERRGESVGNAGDPAAQSGGARHAYGDQTTATQPGRFGEAGADDPARQTAPGDRYDAGDLGGTDTMDTHTAAGANPGETTAARETAGTHGDPLADDVAAGQRTSAGGYDDAAVADRPVDAAADPSAQHTPPRGEHLGEARTPHGGEVRGDTVAPERVRQGGDPTAQGQVQHGGELRGDPVETRSDADLATAAPARDAGVDAGTTHGSGAATGAGAAATSAGAAHHDVASHENGDGGERAALVTRDRAESYGARWDSVKGEFVDEPRRAVANADALVGELLDELQELFRQQRTQIEQGLDRDETSTEDLRLALRRYRSFFDRLLSI